jgi:hypothetical protein
MTRDDIIRLAREAGMPEWLQDDWFADPFDSFALRFASLVAAAEREECAKRLDAIGCDHCATNIRLRGQ